MQVNSRNKGVNEREMNRQDVPIVPAHLIEQLPGFSCATDYSLEKPV